MQESAIPPDPSASSVPAAPAADSGPAPAPVPAPGAGPMPAASAPAGGPAAASPVFAYDDGEPFDVEAYFDPDYGPPEGEDAWLAQVASPVADEYLAAHQPAPAAREVLAAGFTHRDREPGARGWAAGGALDVMEPGPVLAGFADDAISGGLPTLSDDELIGVLCAARRLASRAAGIELAAVTDLNARREAHAVKVRDRRQAEHVGDEIAAALRLTCRAADKLLALAVDVTRLPAVLKALADGRIDLPKAGVYAAELAGLPDLPAAAIAAVTITEAAGLTTGELGALLRRLVLAHDPDAARKRRQKAEKGARVETWAEAAGTAALAGRDLPPADALAADKNIDDHARQLKKAGAPGTLEWLRAQVFTALLTSQPLSTLLPGGNGHGSRNSGGDDGPRGDNGHPRGDNDNPGGDDGPGEGGGGIPPTVARNRADRRPVGSRLARWAEHHGGTWRIGEPDHPVVHLARIDRAARRSRRTRPAGRRHQPRSRRPHRRHPRQPLVPDDHRPRRPRHRARLRPSPRRSAAARRLPATKNRAARLGPVTHLRGVQSAGSSRAGQRRHHPVARRAQDQLAGNHGLRPRPRDPRLPAISKAPAPDQDPRPDLHVPRLPKTRPAMRRRSHPALRPGRPDLRVQYVPFVQTTPRCQAGTWLAPPPAPARHPELDHAQRQNQDNHSTPILSSIVGACRNVRRCPARTAPQRMARPAAGERVAGRPVT